MITTALGLAGGFDGIELRSSLWKDGEEESIDIESSSSDRMTGVAMLSFNAA